MRKNVRCPHCDRVLFNRCSPRCGHCNQPIPADLQFDSLERQEVEAMREATRKSREEFLEKKKREDEERRKTTESTGYFPIILP